MTTLTLTEFLLARIAEREAKAYRYREVEPEPGRRFTWTLQSDIGVFDMVELRFEDGSRSGMSWLAFREEHMELFLADPLLLAECEAKRQIVRAYLDERTRRDIYQSPESRAVEDDGTDLLGQTQARRASAARCRGLEIAVEGLASAYADHPDYREEWRP